MKKLSFLLFATILTVGALTSCGSGTDTKTAADTAVLKKDTPMTAPAMADTSKMDTGKGRPIIPPNTKK